MKLYRIIRKFMSEQKFCCLTRILLFIFILIVYIMISGCVESERTYTHAAPQNYTEYLTLYPDGSFTGVFYEDRYFPQIALSGAYRNTQKEIILIVPSGHTIIFTKSGDKLIFEGDTWE